MQLHRRLGRGFRLGISGLGIVSRDKTLLAFPAISTAAVVLTLLLFYVAVGPDKIQLFLNTLRNEKGVQVINWGYYMVVVMAYLCLAIFTTYFSLGLVGCARISTEERDSQLRDGMRMGLRFLPSIVIWAVVSSTIGVLFTLLDLQRHTSRALRWMIGAPWSVLTYLVVPVMVAENTNIFAAFARSRRLMHDTWGDNLVPQFNVGGFFVLLNLPVAAVLLVVWLFGYTVGGWWVLLVAFYIASTLLLTQTTKAVLTLVIYNYAVHGAVPERFREEHLAHAFDPREEAKGGDTAE